MRANDRKSKSLQRLLVGGCTFLVLAAACGSNPQLVTKGDSFHGGAGLGEACTANDECSASLICGAGNVCVGACGDVTGSSCGDEACLPDGRCSQGLGRNCVEDGDCNDGLVCSDVGRCSVPCEAGAEHACKKDDACRDDGTCPTDRDIVIGIGGAPGAGGADGGAGAPSCIDVDVDFTPQTPTVLLLIDRSGSMNADNFGAAVKQAVSDGTYTLGDCPEHNDWRWNVVRDVLMNPTKGIVKPLEERVRFGLSLYTSKHGQVNEASPEEVDATKMCPVLIDVPIALDNHQAILDEFKCGDIQSENDTPTGESLLAAAATLRAFKEPGPKVIVLATDGEPDNCECPDFGGNVPAKCKVAGMAAMVKAQVVATAEQIHADDITIHVINVSTPSEASLQQHLTEVADAGGGNVYPGFSPGALSSAFDEIIDGVRSCAIDLSGEIADGKESTGTVTLDGQPLELDDPNGWQVNTPSQIELLGDACETIKRGDHDLAIKFPCESFEPVVH
jgi:hypothetical protein